MEVFPVRAFMLQSSIHGRPRSVKAAWASVPIAWRESHGLALPSEYDSI
jgi:hypothetical protein